MAGEPLAMEQRAELRRLAEAATAGPWFTGADDAKDCAPHRDSGLATVDTGRASDWPVARLCEWPTARYIAACSPDVILALLDELEPVSSPGAVETEGKP